MQQSLVAKPLLNVDKNNLAIKGYDLISYTTNQPQKGTSSFSAVYQGNTYWFVSPKHLEQFKQNPERYLPACGGWCAYAMLEGKKVEINPKSFKWIDQKLYLFYDGLWGDTLKKWNQMAKNNQSEKKLLDQLNQNWAALKK
jgi:YHS domain-containing protein